MQAEILKIYKKLRKPYTSKYFTHVIMGKAGACLSHAKYIYEITKDFQELENQNLVKISIEADYCSDYDDLAGDCYNIEINAGSVSGGARTIWAQEKAFKQDIENYGVWGIVGKVKCPRCGNWITVSSVWGFVGDSWKDDQCDIDIMAECIDYYLIN